MKAWQRLAWIEWYRSLIGKQQNRDFLWLTLLLTLTLLLALLLWGSREGLLNKFVDVSVGYIEGAGIPVWLATNSAQGINRDVLQRAPLKLYPYREVEAHEIALVESDAGDESHESVWRNQEVPFQGWAIAFTDPLWLKALPVSDKVDLPLDIVLNESLFKQHFNCARYRENVQQRLPLVNLPPVSQDEALSCLADGQLWLDVKVGSERELLPFRIHWQAHIPTLQKIAFLFPLSTLNMLKLAKRYPDLHYYPEMPVEKVPRLRQLTLWTGEEGLSDGVLDSLLLCFPNAQVNANRITLASPLPQRWLSECIGRQGVVPLQVGDELQNVPFLSMTEIAPTPYTFVYEVGDYVRVICQEQRACQPCEALPVLKGLGNAVNCSDNQVRIDVLATTGSYQKAFAYVLHRQALATQVEQIDDWQQGRSKAFYLHPTYQDALVRFRFIDKIMSILEWLFSPFFLVFLMLLLIVQIGIVVAHREHNYGIFIAKGISWTQIRLLIIGQMTLSFLVAMSLAAGVGESMQSLLAWQLQQVIVAQPYVEHIVASQLDLLPLAWVDYVLVGGIMLGMLYVTTLMLLRVLIMTRAQEPAYLL